MTAKYLASLWWGFLIGVALGSWYVWDRSFVAMGLGIIFLALIVAALTRKTLLVFCLICGLVSGVLYINHSFGLNEYQNLYNQMFDGEGVVTVDAPQVDHNQQITIVPAGKTQAVRASLYQPMEARAGDRVWLRGLIEPPENLSDFDYIGYLQRYNIYAVLKKPQIIVLQRADLSWRSPLSATKFWMIRKSKNLFSGETSSLILGMLIGERGAIPQNVTDDFARTGLSHVIAVSGFNMTILVTMCASLAWYLGRRSTNYLTVVLIFCFAAITGATASVVRAAIMALLVVLAQLFGRLYTSSYALLWAAGIMVLLNPRILAWDVGFQLSVLATIGVLVAYQRLSGQHQSLFKSILLPTLGAIVMTAPIIAYYFHTLSLIAPLANAVLLPLVPWIMFFGALSFVPLIGPGMALFATALANFFLHSVHSLAGFSFSSIEVHISAPLIGTYYFILIFGYFLKPKNKVVRSNQV